MNFWKVKEIVNGNQIRVEPNWVWNEVEGDRVVVNGYLVALSGLPSEVVQELAKKRLSSTILEKEITLVSPTKAGDGILYCNVLFNDIDISKYFLDFDKVG